MGEVAASARVHRNDDSSRYELVVGEAVIGFADFRDTGEVIVFPHTVVEPDHRDQGNGEVLVRGALDDVRAQGRTIVASCWYVREFLALHPDYADLLADP